MTTLEPVSSDEAIRFPSLDSLRAAHAELLKNFRTYGGSAEMIAKVELFIRRGRATGALLDADADRWAAQSQLDYWATQLYQPGYEPPDATLDEFNPQLAPVLDDSLCPYMGLDAFQEANKSVFFGRDRLVSELIGKLKTTRFLAVLGSSGSGKSSIVRAGLIPELKNDAIPGSARWKYFPPMVPGSNPLLNLARLMTTPDEDMSKAEEEAKLYQENSGYLTQIVSERFKNNVVLVVDQFEEVFTLCTDEEARFCFVDNLVALCQAPEAEHRVIITLRSDFEMNIARLPYLQAMFEKDAVRVTPLTASELRESIEAPAARVGLKFEEGVINALLNDTLGEPAALPLLQFTLLKLWEKRERNRVTWETYKKLGGGRQALARSADEFYDQLIPEEQLTMRRILLKMVRPGEGLEVTSNRVPLANLYHKSEANDRINRVLDKLIQARLVRVSEGDMAADDQVEIAHEALVRNWPRLVEWLEEERVTLRQRQRLTTAAEEWQRLNHATSALWRRELLEEALRYDDLNELERQFVNASNARQRRVRISWVAGTVVIIVYLIIASLIYRAQSTKNAQLAQQNAEIAGTAQAASTLAVEQQMLAEQNAAEAKQQAKLALASRLVSQAQLIVETQGSRQTVGVLLAIQSMQFSPSVEATRILQNNVLPTILARMNFDDGVNSLAFSPDGQYIVSGSGDGTARVGEVATGKEISRVNHDKPVNSVAFSPDGKYVVSGSGDNTVRVWEAATGKEIARMSHDDWVNAVAFSPDGQYVVSGSDDNTARVWEVATGKEIARMSHDDWVNAVAFSPDGQYVVSGSDDNTARVWEVATGSEISRMTHNNLVNAVAFSPDGQYVVSGSYDFTVRVWEIATGREISRMAHDDVVNSVAFSPDGQYVVSGSEDATAKVWDAATGNEVTTIHHDSSVWAAAFSQDGQRIVSGSDDGIALVSEAFTGNLIASMNHDGEVRAVAFSPDGQYVASGVCEVLGKNDVDRGAFCYQGDVLVWKATSEKGNVFATHSDWVNVVAFSPDGRYVVSGSNDGTARVWEAATGTEIARMTHDDRVASVAFSPDGRYVVSGSSDDTARVWEAGTGREVSRMTHDNWVNSVAFSPDGRYVVSGSGDGTTRVWEAATGTEITRLTYKDGSVWPVAFSPDGQHVASGGCEKFEVDEQNHTVCSKGYISILEVQSGKEILHRTYNTWVDSVAFSPDGRYVASGGGDGTARVWDVVTGKEIARVTHDDWVNVVAFSPDSQYVVSGSDDGTVRVWEAATGREIARMVHDDWVNTVAFSPDSQFVVSGSSDGTARVWEIAIGKEVSRVTHDDRVNSVSFSPDGQYVVSASADKTVRVWNWNPLDFITSACSRLSRNLTAAEWKQYLGDEPYQATCSNLPIHPTVIAESILPTLLDVNDSNRLQTAIENARNMLREDPTITNADEQAENLVNSTILEKIYNSDPDLEAGRIDPSLVLLEDAKLRGLEIENANILNNTCWFGSIYGYAEETLQFCDQAVALNPDDSGYRDSRGLARALTGDYAGAIEDFQFFVDSEEYDDTLIQQRKQWILDLKAGKNPFTAEVLEMLKGE